jgi:hypothetical protein
MCLRWFAGESCEDGSRGFCRGSIDACQGSSTEESQDGIADGDVLPEESNARGEIIAKYSNLITLRRNTNALVTARRGVK